MRFAYIGLAALAVMAVLVLGFGAMQPREVAVARSTTIAAEPDAIFPYLADFEKFPEWSPWADRDPDMTNVVLGAPGAIGHRNEWAGDRNVGVGSQEIVEIEPNERLCTRLEFEGQGGADACFDLETVAGGTVVTWSFSTDVGASPIAKLFGPMIRKFVGDDYEAGLANLKAVVEA